MDPKILENIKKRREFMGISRKEMAQKLQIPYSTYCNYENGRREPNIDIIFKISQFLFMDIDDILGIEPYDLNDLTDEQIADIVKYSPEAEFSVLSEAEFRAMASTRESIFNSLEKLNTLGKKEAAKRVDELTHIDEYTKDE